MAPMDAGSASFALNATVLLKEITQLRLASASCSDFCRHDPASSVDTPRWATDKTPSPRGDAGACRPISHAIGLDFTYCCQQN